MWSRPIGNLLIGSGVVLFAASLLFAGGADGLYPADALERTEERVTCAGCKPGTAKDAALECTRTATVVSRTTVRSTHHDGPAVPSEFPALALFLIFIGLPLSAPRLLTDGSGPDPDVLSSMRVIFYSMTTLVAVLLVRTAWGSESLGDLKLDPWLSGLLSSLGVAKAAQSFGERST